jgi:hypothetical protein
MPTLKGAQQVDWHIPSLVAQVSNAVFVVAFILTCPLSIPSSFTMLIGCISLGVQVCQLLSTPWALDGCSGDIAQIVHFSH